jgi:predicted methyltransferase
MNRMMVATAAMALLAWTGMAQADPGPALDEVIAGEWRGENANRDQHRNPRETLTFFSLAPGLTVLEVFPGGGWYTDILAPYAARTGGTYVATGVSEALREKLAANPDLYGEPRFAGFSREAGIDIEPGSVDLIVTFRNVHSLMLNDIDERTAAQFYDALKPGGLLGVVSHRLPEDREQPMPPATGYVKQSVAVALFEAAGFELVATSEINANPADTADHPFGVWTLPPARRTAPQGEEPDPDFDRAPYDAIGESDRFTLLFRRPG